MLGNLNIGKYIEEIDTLVEVLQNFLKEKYFQSNEIMNEIKSYF